MGPARATGRRPRLRACTAFFRREAGIGLIEVVAALALFAIASTALTRVLTSSVDAHGFATQQSLGQEAADAQIENIRSLPYDSVGVVNGNPGGAVVASQPASALGVAKLDATVATDISYVGDGIPGGYNQLTNYKEIVVTVKRNSDSRVLSTETTYIAPPTRAPYGGINQVALGVTVTDIGNNSPVAGVPISLSTGPSAPRSDTTDTNGGVLFAGMTANPTSGSTAYYNVAATLPSGYQEMSGDVTQAQLAPGQLSNLSLRVYRPATIYVNLTHLGSAYTGSATVTLTPPSGSAQSYTVTGGSGSIPNLIPNGQYTLTASTAGGMYSAPVTQSVPNDYPNDLTSTFDLALTSPTGTLSVTATNNGTPIAGVAISVTGGPDGVTLTGTTDASGVANFPSVPAGTPGYTVTGTYGASTFQQTGIIVTANQPTAVTLGVPAGSVAVTVKSGSTPIPGASLTLTGPNGFSATGTTGGTGTYTFTNVGSGGGYSLSATKGAATVTQSGLSVSTSSATNVSLNLDVGTIKVSVTNSSSNPVSGAAVTLTGPNSLSVIGTTDASGVYTFTTIGSGSGYSVSASYGAGSASQSGITVTLGSTTNVALTVPTGTIQATVTLGGSAVSGAGVTLTGPGSFSASATTNGSGVATFTAVGAGSGYTVTATYGPATVQQTSVSVTASSTTNVPLAITFGSVKVTVTAGSTPIKSATVTLTGSGGYSATPGTTDASGVYTFTNVPVGNGYTAGATFGTANASQGSLSVTSGNTTNASVALPTGTIKATVTAGGSGVSGQPVTVTSGTYSVSGTTSATGVATITGVPVGTGFTVATNYGGNVQQTGVAVTSGNTTSVTLTVPAGSIKVTVKNQSNAALPGVPVTLAATNGVTVPAGTTDATGVYTFTGLPTPGTYTVTAASGAGSVTSAALTVTNGATTNTSLSLATGTVTVTTKSQGGTNLAGVQLTLNGPNGFSVTGTSAAGTYSFTLVPAGTGNYTVSWAYGAASGTSGNQTVSSGGTTTVAVTIQTGSITVQTKTAGCANQSNVSVSITPLNGYNPGAHSSGGGASYTFTNVPAGTGYTVTAPNDTSENADVTSGGTTTVKLSPNGTC